MASLLNRNGWYYAQFFDLTRTPKRKQIPLRTRTKKTALRLLRVLEDEVAEGKRNPWADTAALPAEAPRAKTLSEAVELFLASRAHLRPASVESYRVRLALFKGHAGAATSLLSVGPVHVRAFLESSKIRDVTRAGYLRHLRVFARWMVRAGLLSTDITATVELRKVPERAPVFLSPQDLDHLLTTIREEGKDLWLLPIIEVTAYLGLRLGEVCALTWPSVDLKRGRLTVSNTDEFTSKSGKERTLPIPARPLILLRERHAEALRTVQAATLPHPAGRVRLTGHVFASRRGGRLNPFHLSRTFSLYRRRAELADGISFHTLRHTAASWLMMHGASIESIRQYLGHSSVTVTQKYAHVSERAYFHE